MKPLLRSLARSLPLACPSVVPELTDLSAIFLPPVWKQNGHRVLNKLTATGGLYFFPCSERIPHEKSVTYNFHTYSLYFVHTFGCRSDMRRNCDILGCSGLIRATSTSYRWAAREAYTAHTAVPITTSIRFKPILHRQALRRSVTRVDYLTIMSVLFTYSTYNSK